MESKELLTYYQQHQNILQKIYPISKTNTNDLMRYLIYIVDTEEEKNYPLLVNFPQNLIFNTILDLQKVLTQLFKNAPTLTENGKKIKNLFQIHLILVSTQTNESFITISESTKSSSFLGRLTNKINIEMWMFWGNLLEQKLNAILEDDQRFRKLIIKNYYREAEEIFYNKTEYKKVEELLVNCLTLAPNDPDSLILMGRCKLFLSQFEAAEDIFNKVTTIQSKNERAWYGLATAQLEIFKMNPKKEHIAYLDAAERNAVQGLSLNNKNIELLNLKSAVFLIRGDVAKSITTLQEALNIRPDDPTSTRNLALALLATAQFNEALQLFEKQLALKPNDEPIIHRIIQCHFELKNNEKAIQLLEAWKSKAKNLTWVNELEMTYLTEIPEEFLNENYNEKQT